MNRISWIFLWRICNKLILLAALFAPWRRVLYDNGPFVVSLNGWNEILNNLLGIFDYADYFKYYKLAYLGKFIEHLLITVGGLCLISYIILSILWLFFKKKVDPGTWRTSLFVTICLGLLIFLSANNRAFSIYLSWGWDLTTVGILSSLLLESREISANREKDEDEVISP